MNFLSGSVHSLTSRVIVSVSLALVEVGAASTSFARPRRVVSDSLSLALEGALVALVTSEAVLLGRSFQMMIELAS